MEFDTKTVNKLLGIDETYKAPEVLMDILTKDIDTRNKLFKSFLKVSTDMSFDWFHTYFQDEQAERKSKKQDFTPDSISELMNRLVNIDSKNDLSGEYYEPAAGTGGILIKKWRQDQLKATIALYDPRNFWYQVEEYSDRAFPFLLFNMAIRGMNGIAIQADSVERVAKQAFIIKNWTSNWLGFSDIIPVPKTELNLKILNLKEWTNKWQ